jgi:hypothetical protein
VFQAPAAARQLLRAFDAEGDGVPPVVDDDDSTGPLPNRPCSSSRLEMMLSTSQLSA